MAYHLSVGEKRYTILSYPGGAVPAPQSLVYSILTLSDGRILVEEEAANLRAFKDYQTDTVLWFEEQGTHPKMVKIPAAKMKALHEAVHSDDVAQDEDATADLFAPEDEPSPEPPAPEPPPAEPTPAPVEPPAPLVPEPEGVPQARAGSPDPFESPQNGAFGDTGPESEDDSVQAWSHLKSHALEADDARDMVLLLSNGMLYVSESHMRDRDVMYYIHKATSRFKTLRLPLKVVYVKMDDLAAIRTRYISSIDLTGNTNSKAITTLRNIIRLAVRAGGTDLHFRVEQDKTLVKIRLNGDLRILQELTAEEGRRMCSATYSTLMQETGGQSSFQAREFQDGQFNQRALPEGLFNIREFNAPTVSSGGATETFTMVLRLQYGTGVSGDIGFKTLGYASDHIAGLQFIAGKKTGINLFSGPMGSGKSTALQAAMRYIIDKNPIEQGRGIHVVTLEDPPEYVIPGASQIPVSGAHGGFAAAIGRIMRFDVNVLMVGEIRDEETAGRAVEVALTGHQVWSTIHANDALSIVRRLADLRVREELLYDHTIFTGFISQRLVPVLCPECSIPLEQSDVDADVRARLDRMFGALTKNQKRLIQLEGIAETPGFKALGEGCPRCKTTGLVGRHVVAEVIVPDPKLMAMLRAGQFYEARHYTRMIQGAASMMDHAALLLHNGLTDPRYVEKIVGWLQETNEETLTVDDIRGVVGFPQIGERVVA